MLLNINTQIHVHHCTCQPQKQTNKQMRKIWIQTKCLIVLLHNWTAPRALPCARRPHANPILIQKTTFSLKIIWSDFMTEIFEFPYIRELLHVLYHVPMNHMPVCIKISLFSVKVICQILWLKHLSFVTEGSCSIMCLPVIICQPSNYNISLFW